MAELHAPELAAIIERIRPTVLAGERVLPVNEVLRPVFPLGGLVRGTRVSVSGAGAASICMAVVAEASRTGSWVAVVGIGSWGWAAAAAAGLRLERSVFVAEPPAGQWGAVMAALVDAVDVVVVDPAHQVSASDARRLTARARERGSVIVEVAIDDGRRRFRWPTEADLSLGVESISWDGLGVGHGAVGERVVGITTGGRRGAARSRTVHVRLGAAGRLIGSEGGSVHHLRSVG